MTSGCWPAATQAQTGAAMPMQKHTAMIRRCQKHLRAAAQAALCQQLWLLSNNSSAVGRSRSAAVEPTPAAAAGCPEAQAVLQGPRAAVLKACREATVPTARAAQVEVAGQHAEAAAVAAHAALVPPVMAYAAIAAAVRSNAL